MKSSKLLSCFILFIFINNSCNKYDDSELWNEIDSLSKRIEAIESQLKLINSEIKSLTSLMNSIENRRYITGISNTVDGYNIVFSDGTSATITDGKDGKDGKDAPILNVRLFNGRYYWTQTIDNETSWLTDEKGNMIPASGIDAATPLLKVDSDGYWIISYNEGKTYSRILDERGQFVTATGKNGDSMFQSVIVSDDELRIILIDGTEIIIPIGDQPIYRSIDLGLSVKWSANNFGADSPSDIGGMYLWGDVANTGNMLNYNPPNEYYISGSKYDIVKSNWGESWRIPNNSEIMELANNCSWEKAVVNGVTGMRITGDNGNNIFLPNTGFETAVSGPTGSTSIINTSNGYYWVGESFILDGERMGYTLFIDKSKPIFNYGWNVKFIKMPIRPVRGY